MNARRPLSVAVHAALCAALVSGCAVMPSAPPPQVTPVLEVRHAGLQADGYYQLGRFLQVQNRYHDAADAYAKALALDPANVDAHNGLGTIHALGGRFGDAQRSFSAALAIEPQNAAVLNNSGYAYLLEGRRDEASAAFGRAVGFEPGNARFRANLQLSRTTAEGPAAEIAAGEGVTTRPAPDAQVPVAEAQAAAAGLPRLIVAAPNVFELVIPPAHRTRSQATALTVAPVARTVGVEVSNANGATGMARRVASQLATGGVRVTRLTNLMPYGRVATRIEFRAGYERAAIEMSRRVPGSPPIVA